MSRGAPREIESSVRFLKLAWECSTPFNTNRDKILQTIWDVEVRDEVRAKYFRDAGYSVIQATVVVRSGMKPFFSLNTDFRVWRTMVAGRWLRWRGDGAASYGSRDRLRPASGGPWRWAGSARVIKSGEP
jgi:hypothetical protein